MPSWRLHYHVVWTTYHREPLITPELERELYGYLMGRVANEGAILHAIGGTPDHVHLAVSVPPKLALATFIGALKGSSSHHINHIPGQQNSFAWQDAYGVVSFAERHLPQVIRYIERQKEHHQIGNLWPLLERMEEEDEAQAIEQINGRKTREGRG